MTNGIEMSVSPTHASHMYARVSTCTDDDAFVCSEKEAFDKLEKLLSINGTKTVDDFHRELGKLMWEQCGMARSKEGLKEALKILPKIREEFWSNVNVPGTSGDLNQALEKANRVADFLESKGYTIEKRPTTKISKDLYSLLCDEFQIDADKKIASKEVVEAKNKEKEELQIKLPPPKKFTEMPSMAGETGNKYRQLTGKLETTIERVSKNLPHAPYGTKYYTSWIA